MRRLQRYQRGSTLLLTLGCLAILTITAAYTLNRVSPRFQIASQFAAWQEAHLAAEAGVDVAFHELELNAIGFEDRQWPGWRQSSSKGIVPALPNTLRQVAGTPLVPTGGSTGLIGQLLSGLGLGSTGSKNGTGKLGLVSFGSSVLSNIGSSVVISDSIFLDNLQLASPGNRPTNTDVQLWAVYPTPSPYYRWFRIRAMATCAIPVVATSTSGDRLDNSLRRYSLRQIRPQLKKDDVGDPMTVPTPNTSRIVEALVEPLLPFEMAILTQGPITLGNSGSWLVDSFDSSDPNKSDAGMYPGKVSPKTQSHGTIASNAARPVDSPYGPLIAANGSIVRGDVATNGGDDPATPAHENVSGAINIDSARVTSDFYRNLTLFARPAAGIFLPPPAPGQPFVAGTVSNPSQYLVTGNLQAFSVVPSSTTEPGAIIIAVNGNVDVPAGTINIAPNTTAIIYIRGNVDFHNSSVNAGGTADQLEIFGEDPHGETRTLSAFGDAKITAAFYGPHYDVKLMDNVEWFGAVAAKSFEMLGGGTGGFHYDQALGIVGAPIGFRIARYIEDVRE